MGAARAKLNSNAEILDIFAVAFIIYCKRGLLLKLLFVCLFV